MVRCWKFIQYHCNEEPRAKNSR